jgi:hypothetical protein
MSGIGIIAPSLAFNESNTVDDPVPASIDRTKSVRDSIQTHRISTLQSSGMEPDMNEPITRRFLESYMMNEEFRSMITLSRERYFSIRLDNDIFNNTDRYYTNGLYFALISPFLATFPLNRLMVPYWGSGKNYYGVSLVQNMYTPSTTKQGGIPEGDRPYAAYLYLSTFKITNDIEKRVRLSSELQVGIMGPGSLGEFVQKSFHNSVPTNDEPIGWENQIRNDLLLNYLTDIEKGLLSAPYLEINGWGTGMLGTVYTNLSGGFFIRAGLFNPYFTSLGFSKRSLNRSRGLHNAQIYFFLDSGGKLVGYDATLEGGLFNQESPYSILPDEISRVLLKGSAGLVFSWGGFQVKAEQFLQSPEFKNGLWHRWLSLGTCFSF